MTTSVTSAEGRRKEAKKGNALPSGSFPIPDIEHLRKAIHLFKTGHGKNRKAALALIKRRARELGRPEMAKGLSLSVAHKSSIHPGLDRKPGVSNWVDQEGGLPNYIERIAKHIHSDSGLSIQHSIAAAVERVKVLAAKGNAQAIKALAEWEAKRSSAHARPNKGSGKRRVKLARPTKSVRSYTGKNETDEDRRSQTKRKAVSERSGAAGVRSSVAGQHSRTVNRGGSRVGAGRQFDENKIVRDQGGKFGNKINPAQFSAARRIVEAAILKLQVGASVKFPGGIGWVQRTEGGYMIQGENDRIVVRTASEAIEAAASVLAPRVQG